MIQDQCSACASSQSIPQRSANNFVANSIVYVSTLSVHRFITVHYYNIYSVIKDFFG